MPCLSLVRHLPCFWHEPVPQGLAPVLLPCSRLAAVLEWQKTNATCLNAPAETGTCAALPEP